MEATATKHLIELTPNGDPFGSGFTGCEYPDPYERPDHCFYRGDVGARSRAWWRNYCICNGYILREWR